MSTEREIVDEAIDQLLKHRVGFVHSPLMWRDCILPIELQWESIKFEEEARELVPSGPVGASMPLCLSQILPVRPKPNTSCTSA